MYSLEDFLIQDKPIGELTRVITIVSGRFISVTNTVLRSTSEESDNNSIVFDAVELSQPEVSWLN